MPTTTNDAAPLPITKSPSGNYDVGYCKPPVAHRFKQGNKANPKGRKKGLRNRKLVIHEVLFESVTVREGGETKQMSALEAVLKKTLSKALSGDNKAALTIIGIAQKEGILTPEQEQVADNLSDCDLAIMEDVRRRLAKPAQECPVEATTPPSDT